MARIFISYAHEDQAAARRIVDALAREGLEAWWDHEIPPGRSWDEIIGTRIAAADAVIVLWSRHSIVSNFVKEEAQIALDSGKLVPVKVDDVEPPVGFRRTHAANLVGWEGDVQHRQWRALLGEIRERLGAPVPPRTRAVSAPTYETRGEAAKRKSPPIAAIIVGLLLIIGGGVFAYTQYAATGFHGPAPDPAAPALAAINRINAQEWSAVSTDDLLTRVITQSSKASLDAAAQSDARAQNLVGMGYDGGFGGYPDDPAEAVRFYRLATEQGSAHGQTLLGAMYAGGHGVEQNHTEAVRLFRLAADQGYAPGQAMLGGQYGLGAGVAQSWAEAARYQRLAANQGYAGGQYLLGIMYERGLGVRADRAEAVRLYQLAARQGELNAQEALRRLGESWGNAQ